ncbi:hypothetical protein Hamer_G007618 [Homarus americanus]|uniref:Uncharacterized protein n=1 Tax=Homarus americanus TaxID=6706 RepID=A0A8J5JM80_HOMAM|nr:hypothetical protein Hamer_G007618 [Homarus americanus]
MIMVSLSHNYCNLLFMFCEVLEPLHLTSRRWKETWYALQLSIQTVMNQHGRSQDWLLKMQHRPNLSMILSKLRKTTKSQATI